MNLLNSALKRVFALHTHYVKKQSKKHRHSEPCEAPVLISEQWQSLTWHEERAGHFSSLFRGGVLMSYLLGFLAVVFAVIPVSGLISEAGLHHYGFIFVLLELAAITIIIAIYLSGMEGKSERQGQFLFQNWKGNWQRHRTICEILRYQDAIAWIRPDEVIKKYNIPVSVLTLTPIAAQDIYAQLETQVDKQVEYNHNRAVENHFIQHRLHQVAKYSFVLTLICCLAHFFIHSALLSALSAILPALGSCCHGIASTAEYEKIGQQCQQTGQQLTDFKKHFQTNRESLLVDDSALRQQVRRFLDIVLDDRDRWYIFTSSSKLPL